MVCKRFEAMGVDTSIYQESSIPVDVPVIVYANHASWWDPILAVLLHEYLFSQRGFYAPIDAEALKKYEVMRKLGFYPVSLDSFGGAADFLRYSKSILESKQSAIWLTPEGKFTDVRDHSVPLMPGLAHLFVSVPRVIAVPLAIEYVFWNEAKPYMLMRIEKPIDSRETTGLRKPEIAQMLTDKLRDNQRILASQVIQRNLAPFTIMHQASPGPKSLYDFARVLKSVVRGKFVPLRHDK